MPSFADRIKELLAEQNPPMSQYRLAELAGVSQPAVTGWLSGTIPYPSTVNRLCMIFGVRRDWLLYGEGKKHLPKKALRDVVREGEPEYGVSLLQKVTFIEQAGTPEQRELASGFLGAIGDWIKMSPSTAPGAARAELARPRGANIIETDPDGKTIYASPAFTQMCGYTVAQLKDKKPGEMLQKNLSKKDQATVRRFSRAIRERRPFECTLTNHRADGAPYPVYIRMHPVFDEKGALVNFRAFAKKLS